MGEGRGARAGREDGSQEESGLERWARWKRLLEDGVYSSRAALARGEGVSRAAVTMGLRKLELAWEDEHRDPAAAQPGGTEPEEV